jgi:hypothetical protein
MSVFKFLVAQQIRQRGPTQWAIDPTVSQEKAVNVFGNTIAHIPPGHP